MRILRKLAERRGLNYIDGANKVVGAHQNLGGYDATHESHDPCADKAFHSLLGRQLDKLGATKGDADHVGEDVVGDDEGSGEEEPDHALKDVVHDEMSLDDDEVQSHVRPGKLGELEFKVTGLKSGDEEDEA